MDSPDLVKVFAYGLVVVSDLPLPLPPHGGNAPADVILRRGRVDTSSVQLAVDHVDESWVEEGWADDRVLLRFPGLVAEFRHDCNTVLIDTLDSDDWHYLAHMVLDHVLPRWLALEGRLVLHAGAVQRPDGEAVVFVGETGRGKSSMTTALGQAGWTVLGDDACPLLQLPWGWDAVPSYPGVRLLAASRAALTPGLPSVPMSSGADKHRVAPEVAIAHDPIPLGLVVELGPETSTVDVTRLSFSEATACIVRHGFHLSRGQDHLARQAFSLAASLAADVPAVRLSFPRRWDVYPEIEAALTALCGTSR
jgi:hypothetical protein